MPLIVRAAGPADVEAVEDILAEVSAWMRARDIVQWPVRFPDGFLLGCARRGELYVASDQRGPVGTVTLQWSDPLFWGDRHDAGFVHRLAVRRSYAGAGRFLLEWAEAEVRARGRSFVCLDTLTSNTRLRRYYEDLGYRPVGEISGPAEHPTDPALGAWRTTLYEKAIDRPETPAAPG
jgi:GNAT superfamily N-acetyltransferase